MKKAIIITSLILSSVLILDGFNAWYALAMFYVAGEIPGTRTSLNPSTMMSIFALLTGFVLARIGNRFVLSVFEYLFTRLSHIRV